MVSGQPIQVGHPVIPLREEVVAEYWADKSPVSPESVSTCPSRCAKRGYREKECERLAQRESKRLDRDQLSSRRLSNTTRHSCVLELDFVCWANDSALAQQGLTRNADKAKEGSSHE